MVKRKTEIPRFDAARNMPNLRHSVPGRDFDIRESEAVRWLVSQPDILQYLFDKIRRYCLVYDRDTGTWRGVDYGEGFERG